MTDTATPSRLYSDTNLQLLELVSRLPVVNPFEPAAERLYHAAITHRPVAADPFPAAGLLDAVERMLLGGMAGALHGVTPRPRDRELLRGAAVYVLRERLGAKLQPLIERREVQVPFRDALLEARGGLLQVPGARMTFKQSGLLGRFFPFPFPDRELGNSSRAGVGSGTDTGGRRSVQAFPSWWAV